MTVPQANKAQVLFLTKFLLTVRVVVLIFERGNLL